MNEIASTYIEGLMAKCAEHGIDPEQLVKSAAGLNLRRLPKVINMTPSEGKLLEAGKDTALKMGPPKFNRKAWRAFAKLQARAGVEAGRARKIEPSMKDIATPKTVATNPQEQQWLDQAAAGARRDLGAPVNSASLRNVGDMRAKGVELPAAGESATAVVAPTGGGTIRLGEGGKGVIMTSPPAPKEAPAKTPGLIARTTGHPLTVAGGVAAGAYGTSKIMDPLVDSTGETGGNIFRTIRNYSTGRDMNAPWLDPEAAR